jgi:hypothetical protein
MKNHLRAMAHEKASMEIKITQITDNLKFEENENSEMREQLKE